MRRESQAVPGWGKRKGRKGFKVKKMGCMQLRRGLERKKKK